MSEATRVVALGQPVAGDDGAALDVVARLRQRRERGEVLAAGGGPQVELLSASEPSRLVELLCHPGPVWVVDAVVCAGTPGQVLELNTEMLSRGASCSVSSHGMDVRQAIELCALLYPGQVSPEVRIFAISIDAPRQYEQGLSPSVAAAVERCVERLQGELSKMN